MPGRLYEQPTDVGVPVLVIEPCTRGRLKEHSDGTRPTPTNAPTVLPVNRCQSLSCASAECGQISDTAQAAQPPHDGVNSPYSPTSPRSPRRAGPVAPSPSAHDRCSGSTPWCSRPSEETSPPVHRVLRVAVTAGALELARRDDLAPDPHCGERPRQAEPSRVWLLGHRHWARQVAKPKKAWAHGDAGKPALDQLARGVDPCWDGRSCLRVEPDAQQQGAPTNLGSATQAPPAR